MQVEAERKKRAAVLESEGIRESEVGEKRGDFECRKRGDFECRKRGIISVERGDSERRKRGEMSV